MTATRSVLHDEHVALGATLVEFAGWEMPVRYTSDIAEHNAVRSSAGIFDLSHMGEISVRGDDAVKFLEYALVGRMGAVGLGRAKYTMMCAPDGGIIDDLVVYRRDWDHFVIVANAGNRDVVVEELMARSLGLNVSIEDQSNEIALIAIQGPRSVEIVTEMISRDADNIGPLPYYAATNVVLHGDVHAFVARTGYTGEDGFELFVSAADAREVWRLALATGGDRLLPCGLSSRDTLRLEAGMPLYGQELSRQTNPFAAGLGRVVAFGTDANPRGDFVGRGALETARDAAPTQQLVGLLGDGKRSPRAGYSVTTASGEVIGTVTSGAPSPTLGRPIGMAYVAPEWATPGTEVLIDVRGRGEPMTVAALPLYRRP